MSPPGEVGPKEFGLKGIHKEVPVARPWRLRHKLSLGLALVVGSVALLLGGAIFGLTSYSETIRTTHRKMQEMQIVAILRGYIQNIRNEPTSVDDSTPINRERAHIEKGIFEVEATLKQYQITLLNQYPTGNDGSLHENAHIGKMREALNRLRDALAKATRAGTASGKRLFDDENLVKAHKELELHAAEHFSVLVDDVNYNFARSTANHRRSMFISGFATIMAVLLVMTLLYYFRVWVFTPIRALQAGVHRVHTGDFNHPIQLHSQDELQELANEFNAMTLRMQDIYRELENQINERTRQLVRSERMVSVGFLAAGVAHEINNPLASVAFCAEALERRLQNIFPQLGAEGEVARKYLRMIQDESQRCKQITQKLLDFSRSGGKREQAELTQVVNDVIEVARVLPNARNKVIRFAPTQSVIIPISVPDIKGVALNLIVNALDSMEESGGQVDIDVTMTPTHAEIAFTDTGCGMAPETLQNIFEPFFTRSRTGNGTGLGLSISHQIIDQHGGTISATSRGPGQGSTFLVRLPLTETMENTDTNSGSLAPVTLPFPGRQTAVA
jgi:two-component system, NtrC family, sensor kinase